MHNIKHLTFTKIISRGILHNIKNILAIEKASNRLQGLRLEDKRIYLRFKLKKCIESNSLLKTSLTLRDRPELLSWISYIFPEKTLGINA